MPLDFIKTELPNQKNENAQLVNNHFQFDFKNSNRSNFDEKNSLSTISKNNVTPVPLLNSSENPNGTSSHDSSFKRNKKEKLFNTKFETTTRQNCCSESKICSIV